MQEGPRRVEVLRAGQVHRRLSGVRRLLREFHAEGIDSLVLDLRNNGGGSLEEANALAGLFIDTGPIVQVRNANERVRVLNLEKVSLTASVPCGGFPREIGLSPVP